ncbi:Oidioi.mRNA.OKI2018_I69.chr1.g3801.t1.cds [Oikopleura dioica]|uniref:Oidioi.mRNA.OKI2018_I69.chr1.g3801.t1.cds n=1 Tax=Oikopleura dioica TaxID=34765 RepID=A0ABN7SYT5_OIKDI|nr:Oidioi.mRNA.OKI2018_I69.chr1.g3801.t1.cds [Oikopleura dioica]
MPTLVDDILWCYQRYDAKRRVIQFALTYILGWEVPLPEEICNEKQTVTLRNFLKETSGIIKSLPPFEYPKERLICIPSRSTLITWLVRCQLFMIGNESIDKETKKNVILEFFNSHFHKCNLCWRSFNKASPEDIDKECQASRAMLEKYLESEGLAPIKKPIELVDYVITYCGNEIQGEEFELGTLEDLFSKPVGFYLQS